MPHFPISPFGFASRLNAGNPRTALDSPFPHLPISPSPPLPLSPSPPPLLATGLRV
ncbi:hypothetical protein [Tolypothrix sp. VBCCA 56010]|uniref:hypothetical protein n=1 Tax=Tolypothrix sp. VBCCA 56010 TaxID=3137731 RepID=UPI003D7C4CF7